jgi:crossover junction endodeoxyribonuclease RuvC
MKILGIDPGTAICGWGMIEMQNCRFRLVDYGVIETRAGVCQSERLGLIFETLPDINDKSRPEAVAVEELFFFKNLKTVIKVSEARGVITLCARQKNLAFFEYTPLQVKQALVGYGRADKNQVQQMVRSVLKLKEIPKPDDAADALAVAICHGQTNQLLR